MELKHSNFYFSDPYLTRMCFEAHEDYDHSADHTELQIPIKSEVKVSKGPEKKARVSLTVEIAEQTRDYPFYLSATMAAFFQWDEGAYSDDTVEELLHRNAPALLLGYLRPQIAQITEASPIETIHLPFMNFLDSELAED